MILRPRSAVLLAAVSLVLGGLAAQPASSDVVNRPDLTVTKGTVRASGDHAERIKGTFIVRNAGSLPVVATKALVQAKKGQRWRSFTELRILPLGPRKSAAYAFNARRPTFIALGGSYPVRVCLDVNDKVREVREGNNCRALGTLRFELVEDEVDYQPDQKFFHSSNGVGYWGWVPAGYDPATPTTLFVWMHGCGGQNEFDIEGFHAASDESFVTIAPSGREGKCWRTPKDAVGSEELVVNAIEDAVRHFNIADGKVVLGGYSSGGDLAYRIGYLFSDGIDAVLVCNTSPFRDTGLDPDVLSQVSHRFRVVHLAHLQDEAYPIATVRSELQQLTAAGFTVTSVEREGGHYEEPGQNGHPGTDADIREVLLPQVVPVG
jgi:predicted esterase